MPKSRNNSWILGCFMKIGADLLRKLYIRAIQIEKSIFIVTTQHIFFCRHRVLIYQASATGRCSRAYRDVFTQSIPYAFSPHFGDVVTIYLQQFSI